jgi:drug/metabolite transporter (DMT)-like permease
VRIRSRGVAYASFTAICVIWGTTFLAIRVALDTIPTLYLTGIRFTSAGLLLLLVALARGERLPRRRAEWRHEAITGVIMVAIANASLVWSEHYISSGLAALLAATIPLWMAALDAMFIRNEVLSPRRIAGLVVGFCGVGLLVLPGFTAPDRHGFLLGVLGTQVSAIAWSAGTIRSKYRPSGVGGAMGPAMQMLLGGIVVSIVGLAATPLDAMSFTPRTMAALAYLSIFGSVIAFTAYHIALKTIAPGRVALYAYVNPAVAVVAGALVLQEVVTWRMIAAMVVILSGVTLARSGRAGGVTPLTQQSEERAA